MSIDHSVLKNLGLTLPEILLPAAGIDHDAWAVIACDQHSSDPKYWNRVSDFRNNSPSTLDLILPEVYLKNNPEKRIQTIQKNMKQYLQQGLLQNRGRGWVYVQRHGTGLRQGIVLGIDLEQYDFSPDSSSLIRTTEGTILERLPPRIRIREGAALELPHVMVLINDQEQTVIESLKQQTERMEQIYDFDLMLDGGRLTGYWLDDSDIINETAQRLLSLSEQGPDNLLFAVGDGNHSLAAAKSLWENIRDTQLKDDPVAQEQHPARYALVELVNIHSPGLRFEAIYRCLFKTSSKAFYALLKEEGFTLKPLQPFTREALSWNPNGVLFYSDGQWKLLEDAGEQQACGVIDKFFARYKQKKKNARMDFIHGWQHTQSLADQRKNRIAVFFNPIPRENLFPLIAESGPLPRKSFSMGNAEEKRYYFEARKIQ